jgi:hypothetical protein
MDIGLGVDLGDGSDPLTAKAAAATASAVTGNKGWLADRKTSSIPGISELDSEPFVFLLATAKAILLWTDALTRSSLMLSLDEEESLLDDCGIFLRTNWFVTLRSICDR